MTANSDNGEDQAIAAWNTRHRIESARPAAVDDALVERVARAILCADEDINEATNQVFVDYWIGGRDPETKDTAAQYRRMARAALSAISPDLTDALIIHPVSKRGGDYDFDGAKQVGLG